MMKKVIICLQVLSVLFIPWMSSCQPAINDDSSNKMVVSVRDQKMALLHRGKLVKAYKVSTSKFGLGDIPGSNRTPLGTMKVAKKIGYHQPPGAVFKSRRPTGEVISPNSPGRDPIISRILWLKGTDYENKNAFRRYIYIHGSPEHQKLGYPVSYGCIRMGSTDVIDLFNRVGTGAEIEVIRGSLPNLVNSKTKNLVAR